MLLWHRPWLQHIKVPPIRAEYLARSGPMRVLHYVMTNDPPPVRSSSQDLGPSRGVGLGGRELHRGQTQDGPGLHDRHPVRHPLLHHPRHWSPRRHRGGHRVRGESESRPSPQSNNSLCFPPGGERPFQADGLASERFVGADSSAKMIF